MSEKKRILAKAETGLVYYLALLLLSLAAATLFALMAITCVDVIGRYFFNSPLSGSTELTEFAMAVLIFTTLPVVTWREEHVVVDLFDSMFSAHMAKVRSTAISLISAIALAYLGLRINVLGHRSLGYGEISEYLGFPPGYIMLYSSYLCWLSAATVITYGIFRVWRLPR